MSDTGEYRTVVSKIKCHLDQVITQQDSVDREGQVVAREIIMSTPETPDMALEDLKLEETNGD